MKFNEIGLSEELLRGIEEMGFEEASPIQKQAIGPMIEGKDIIGQAQTGTGKTAAFGIPMLELVGPEKTIQGLVLCPTRELSIQVSDELSKLGKYKNIKILPVYGGASIDRQIKSIKRGVQIIVGTPGRVMDHMRRKTISFKDLKVAVLDEADEMFNMGFRDDMQTIFDQTNDTRQTCFFSATMGPDIQRFSKRYQDNPEVIRIEHKNLTVDNIDQHYIELNENMKTEIVSRIIDLYNPDLSIIFCNTKKRVDNLVNNLNSRGYSVDGLHGDLRQNQRDNVMNKFRNANIDILVATDVAARGIDIGNVDLVINYDLPQDEEYYVHRIGRTARAGKTGQSISFVTSKDIGTLKGIRKYTNANIKYLEIPTIDDMDEKNTLKLEKTIEERLESKEDFTANRRIIDNLLEKGYTPTQIGEALIDIALEKQISSTHEKLSQVDFGEKFSFAKGRSMQRDSKGPRSGGRKSNGGKLFLNKGARDGLSKRDILNFVSDNTSIPRNKIGDIIIKRNFSFVFVNERDSDKAVNALNGKNLKGSKVQVEKSGK